MGLARELSQGPRRRSAPKMRPVFYRLHAATLNRGTTLEELRDALEAAEAMPERRRLSEGAVYTAALRRWEFMTGEPYTREQQPVDTTSTSDREQLAAHRIQSEG